MSFLFGSAEEREAKKRAETALREELLARRQEESAKEKVAQDKRADLRSQIELLKQEKREHLTQAGKIFDIVNPEIRAAAIAKAPKWEYLVQSDIGIDDLDKLGEIGWELISITSFETGGNVLTVHMRYVFKRPTLREEDYPEVIHKKAQPAVELMGRVKELDAEIEDFEGKLNAI